MLIFGDEGALQAFYCFSFENIIENLSGWRTKLYANMDIYKVIAKNLPARKSDATCNSIGPLVDEPVPVDTENLVNARIHAYNYSKLKSGAKRVILWYISSIALVVQWIEQLRPKE